MPLRLVNTLTRQLEEFHPQHAGDVSLYTCGPTVYNYAHIGNLRTFIFYDLLRRVLEHNGYTVKHVMNITDVGHLTDDADAGEDKMEKGARREGKSVWDIAQFFTDAFLRDSAALNLLEPHLRPKATDHIAEQIALVQQLEQKGLTYRTDDGIYFDTAQLADYGKLAHLDIAGLREGARVEKNAEKRNPTDFALWKFSPQGVQRQMEWKSPWGVGFPGWHIECSAMAMKYLGETLDIHAGGVDHVPVHHTNEIAQSEAATGKPFSRIWMHGEFLLINQGRMGKSEGNFLTLQSLVDKGFDPLAYRYFTFTAHYASKLNFTWDALQAAQNAYHRLINTIATWDEPKIGCAEFEQRFTDAMNDNLNAPQALAVLWELMKSNYPTHAKAESIFTMDKVLGLSLRERAEALASRIAAAGDDIHELVAQREKARATKDFSTADRLRDHIRAAGLVVEDTPDGPVLKITV